MIFLLADTETHPEDLFLPGGQRNEDLAGLFGQVDLDNPVGRGNNAFVLDEVFQVTGVIFSDGCFQGYGLSSSVLSKNTPPLLSRKYPA